MSKMEKLMMHLINRAVIRFQESDQSLNDACQEIYSDSATEDLNVVQYIFAHILKNKDAAKSFQIELGNLDHFLWEGANNHPKEITNIFINLKNLVKGQFED